MRPLILMRSRLRLDGADAGARVTNPLSHVLRPMEAGAPRLLSAHSGPGCDFPREAGGADEMAGVE